MTFKPLDPLKSEQLPEKDLKKVQVEDSRAVGLYVSGKITERELDHQRMFINERMETAHAKVEDYRAQASMKAEKRALAGNIVRWVEKIGEGIDNLPPEDLRKVLGLVVDEIVIDRDNHVTITLGIPTNDLLSIDKDGSRRLYDGGVHDGSLPQPQSLGLQVGVDLIQKTLTQLVFLQEMPEIQDGCLVGQGA